MSHLCLKVVKLQNGINKSCQGWSEEFENVIQTKKNLVWTKDVVKNLHIKVAKFQNVISKSCHRWSEEFKNVIQTKNNFIQTKDMVKNLNRTDVYLQNESL